MPPGRWTSRRLWHILSFGLSRGNCSGVWWCRAIVLFDRVGSGYDERDLNGDERIVTELGHGPQVAVDSRLGLAIWLAGLTGGRRKWVSSESVHLLAHRA